MKQYNRSIFFSFLEVKELLLLTIPLAIAGLAEASVDFFSTVFSGHIDHYALGATALISTLFSVFMGLLWGIFSIVSVLVAQYHSIDNRQTVIQIIKDGLYIALFISLPSMFIIWHLPTVLLLFGQQPEIVVLAKGYLHGLAWGIIPDCGSIVLLQFLLGIGRTKIVMKFNLFLIMINIGMNYILMFGKLGFPLLGVAGIGWGTSIAMWVLFLTLCCYFIFYLKYTDKVKEIPPKQKSYINELIKLGLPIGVMYFIEVGFFMAFALLMGNLSSEILAAHQITVQYFIFVTTAMFSLANVVTVKVSHYVSQQNIIKVQQTNYAAILIAIVFMICIGTFYCLYPQLIISVDLNIMLAANQTIVKFASHFLFIAAIFQIPAAVSIVVFGALRGLKDTKFPMVISALCFWGIALPLSYTLVIYNHWNPVFAWWSLVLAASCEVIILMLHFQKLIKSQLVQQFTSIHL